ncbi:DUF502 domain-containing protein [Halosegnis sp.]|uniref:DUF502 domain-containing protein n=1 Tax=Halosegnis sp. TaxID=2864959 RepID=UPI0035D46172
MDVRAESQRSFIAGLLLVAPLAVTLFVGSLALRYLAGVLDPVVQAGRLAQYTGNSRLLAQTLAALLLATAVVGLGYVAQRQVGQRLFGGFDRLVRFVPLVSAVYSSVRQVGAALENRSSRYESVVLVEYPRLGVYSLGFVTGDAPADASTVADEPVYNVFIPNSPNPTGGELVLVPESHVHETDLSVRRGLRLIVTTGIADTQDELAAFREDA